MDWYDGEPVMTISQAFACMPKRPPKPEKPAWDNTTAVYTNSELGSIYELVTEADRFMHDHTCSHCFVWNYPNQTREDGFRLFTYRSFDGWARVSIQTRKIDDLIAGTGSRMYAGCSSIREGGDWLSLIDKWGVRAAAGENLLLLDFGKAYVYGERIDQSHVDAMCDDVLNWWRGLPQVDVTIPDEVKARKPVFR